jgi:hypothetical protein
MVGRVPGRTATRLHVRGLLHTEDYARAVFDYVIPELPENERALRVEHRMRRRQALTREGAASYEALVHESVLRTRVADRRVARAQLDELLSQSE